MRFTLNAGRHRGVVGQPDDRTAGLSNCGCDRPPENGNSLALLRNGKVVAWGDDSYGKAEVPSSATNIMAIRRRVATIVWLCKA